MKNLVRILDVAPPRLIDIPFDLFLLTFITIICFVVFIILLIFAIKQWKNYKEQKGTKKKFIIEISISVVFVVLFVLGCLIVIPELKWYL